MKTTIQFITIAFLAIFFTNCSSCNRCKVGYIDGEKKILVKESYGAKGGFDTVEKTVKVRHHCKKCGSFYCPKPECCGIINNSVLSRATGQSGTGEPPIGLIPTMKTLAPDINQ